jgi:hypothetical protein
MDTAMDMPFWIVLLILMMVVSASVLTVGLATAARSLRLAKIQIAVIMAQRKTWTRQMIVYAIALKGGWALIARFLGRAKHKEIALATEQRVTVTFQTTVTVRVTGTGPVTTAPFQMSAIHMNTATDMPLRIDMLIPIMAVSVSVLTVGLAPAAMILQTAE